MRKCLNCEMLPGMSDATVNDVSDTALWVAYFRVLENELKNPAYRDPFTALLIDERAKKIAEDLGFSKAMWWNITMRTTGIDQLVMHAIAHGADTVINLGAGLDTRPYRLELPKKLRWFEVDKENLIAHKTTRLASQPPRCELTRIAMDLSQKNERRAFFEKVAKDSRRALILTEGLLPYLDKAAVSDLTTELHSYSPFYFWIQEYYGGAIRISKWKNVNKKLKQAPIVFKPESWLKFFETRGWKVKEKISALDETRRLKRRVPFVWPWSLLKPFLPFAKPELRERLREAFGYVLFEKA